MPGSSFDIRATDGSGVFQGYLALPASGKGPGLVLLQEIFGVNQNIRTIAQIPLRLHGCTAPVLEVRGVGYMLKQASPKS